jgi:glycosyltransferase involved in cell wall biosynthesis
MLQRAMTGAPPTILQVLPRLQTGGVERGTIEMAQAICEAGWRAVVASEGGRMERELTRLGAVHVTLPLATKNPLKIKRNVAALSQVIKDHQVSLVHARSRAPAWSALKAARACGVPFMTTFHGTYNMGYFGLKQKYNAVMAMGDRVIAISQFIRRHILSNYHIDDSLIRVVHRGVDFDEPVIMLPGRLTRWKGQLLLIDALKQIKDLRFRCLLVGSDQGRTAYREEIERAIDAAGLRDRVQVADDCHDMPAAYMLADVVVSASTDPEAFGRVSAEAQAMGRPVIAPDHGAAPEIVQHHQTGWLFAAMHPGSLATMLREALTLDRQARAVYAQRAMAHARASFSKDQMCTKTLAVYQELLSERGA